MLSRLPSRLFLTVLCAATLLTTTTAARAAGPGPDRETFEEVRRMLIERQVDAEQRESALWAGAIEGMLSRLDPPGGQGVHKLLSPKELAGLRAGLGGSISGIGARVEQQGDLIVVQGTLAGGPAEAAKLRAGDRILAVNGKPVRGRSLAEVISEIRGPEGSEIELLLQRDTEEWTQTLRRGRVQMPALKSERLGADLLHLRLLRFGAETLAELNRALEEALGAKRPARGLLLDLRGCPGGLLDQALAIAGGFLDEGAVILRSRDKGGTEELHRAEATGPWAALPVVVLVDRGTASGGEILAAALRGNRGSLLVGEKTYGKGTVESLEELPHGWAIKYTVARFTGPQGESWDRSGITPDFQVAAAKAPGGADPVLAAAETLLRLQLKAR